MNEMVLRWAKSNRVKFAFKTAMRKFSDACVSADEIAVEFIPFRHKRLKEIAHHFGHPSREV